MVNLYERLPADWKEKLNAKLEDTKLKGMLDYIEKNIYNTTKNRELIFPPENKIFQAFKKTPFEKVKVVIIGQDPYHGEGIADGLAFSVGNDSKPSSLRNIFNELLREDEIKRIPENQWSLEKWTQEGVLLLNTILTVEKGKPKSHRDIGWEIFTDLVIETISFYKKFVIFLLWGNNAKKKEGHIDKAKHSILASSHPSGLSFYKSFNNCNHFKEVNNLLEKNKIKRISWYL